MIKINEGSLLAFEAFLKNQCGGHQKTFENFSAHFEMRSKEAISNKSQSEDCPALPNEKTNKGD
ncbi:hypothetical protein [Lysobacter sp. N42]|uniref:hypothetical protein n=1 Tax=Lysobacter sp. N42 TaxID=2545719 RepID=UPI000DCF729F|nr:hypothetical protein [Lysobacter sp. N42]TCZ89480.1 hypothetical protein EYQ95_11375 [Lysobacter sp. N42]